MDPRASSSTPIPKFLVEAASVFVISVGLPACGLLNPEDDKDRLRAPTTAASLQLGPPDSEFQKVVLAVGIVQPQELAVAHDRRGVSTPVSATASTLR